MARVITKMAVRKVKGKQSADNDEGVAPPIQPRIISPNLDRKFSLMSRFGRNRPILDILTTIMNSPPEPASPALSTPSSGSPSPEEINATYQSSTSTTSNLLNLVTSTLSPSSKRRLPGSGAFGGGSSRDAKSRRREDPRRMAVREGTGGNWEGKESSGRKEKDDLVDAHIVDWLRKGTYNIALRSMSARLMIVSGLYRNWRSFLRVSTVHVLQHYHASWCVVSLFCD